MLGPYYCCLKSIIHWSKTTQPYNLWQEEQPSSLNRRAIGFKSSGTSILIPPAPCWLWIDWLLQKLLQLLQIHDIELFQLKNRPAFFDNHRIIFGYLRSLWSLGGILVSIKASKDFHFWVIFGLFLLCHVGTLTLWFVQTIFCSLGGWIFGFFDESASDVELCHHFASDVVLACTNTKFSPHISTLGSRQEAYGLQVPWPPTKTATAAPSRMKIATSAPPQREEWTKGSSAGKVHQSTYASVVQIEAPRKTFRLHTNHNILVLLQTPNKKIPSHNPRRKTRLPIYCYFFF